MENSYMPVILSSRIRDILIKIGDNISSFILSLENNNDYTYSFSFLDITDDESTISFLQTNKYDDLPKVRGNGDLAWTCSSRNEIRAGRLINKIAPFYKANEIEKWVNSFKAEYKNSIKNIRFKVIDGKDIVKFYNGRRYARGNGSLNKSCMRHDNCADYMELYTNNKDKIKMLILLDGDREIIGGRALLWKLDEPNGTWLLDRIYVKEDSDAILFKKHAEKNGWLYKSTQTFDCVKFVKDGNDVNIDMRVYVNGDYKTFPYLDTLQYYNKKDNYLTNIEYDYENIPQIVKLRELNGRDSGNENFTFDELNKEYIKIDDAVFCFYGDGYTHKNNAVFVKEFDEYAFPSELRYSTYHKRFLTNQSSVYSKTIGSFVMNSDINKVYMTKDKKTYDFLFKNLQEKNYVRLNGNYYINDLIVKGSDGNYYFKDEYDEKTIMDEKEIQRKAVDEIIKSSAHIRDVMGIKKKKNLFEKPTRSSASSFFENTR